MITDHERGVLRDVFGINPDTVDMDWDSNLSWCVLQYGELKSDYLWSLYLAGVENDEGVIDDLAYHRERKRLGEKYDRDIDSLKTEAWETMEWSDG